MCGRADRDAAVGGVPQGWIDIRGVGKPKARCFEVHVGGQP